MPGFGFGFGPGMARRRRPAATDPAYATVPGLLSPSAGWTGTAGTGFGGGHGAAPSDPVRTTAKPVCRLIVPPNQYFTDELLVGVWAGANDAGSLMNTMGLLRVTAHFEGATLDIPNPSFQTFADANGVARTYFGWWVRLKKPAATAGHAQLYFEAVPRDAAMQNRVIGPFQFSPQTSLNDITLEVAATPAEITGVRYKTLTAALDYCRTSSRKNPLIQITEAGTYVLGAIGAIYEGAGYATVTASVAVTIVNPAYVPGSTLSYFRPRYNGIRFKGANITVDFEHGTEFYTENFGVTRQAWFDGCALVNSAGRYSLFNLGARNGIDQLIRGNPILTECTATWLYNVAINAMICRGVTMTECWSDLVDGAWLALDNRVNDFDSSDYRAEISAMSVSYTGAEATATLALSGYSGGSRTFTAKYGANTATYAVDGSEASFIANTHYTVQNVVDWLNGLPGWSATLIDGTRRANYVQLPGTVGAWGDTNVKGVTLGLVTMVDVHPDFAQTHSTENIVIAGNIVRNAVCQQVFLTDGPCKDYAVVNNAFAEKPGGVMQSQLNRTHSHVIIAHNSWATQAFDMRKDSLYDPDTRCLVSNNTAKAITWSGGSSDADLGLSGNHLQTGASAPAGSTGTTIGGTSADLFANPSGGDFTPAGALLTNLKTPIVKYDLAHGARGATAPAGALK